MCVRWCIVVCICVVVWFDLSVCSCVMFVIGVGWFVVLCLVCLWL